MSDAAAVTGGERRVVHRIAADLHHEFLGVFGIETVEQLLLSSLEEMAARSTSRSQFRVVLVERFARERLRALAKVEGHIGQGLPGVLFLCVHNAGRSQMALGWFEHFAGNRAMGWSGGSQPGSAINHAAVSAMAEIGSDIAQGFTKPWTEEVLLAADVIVTMGCGDACPLVPGKRYEDWEIDDPDGMSLEQVRLIRDQIGAQVHDLLTRLNLSPDPDHVANRLAAH